MAYQKDLQLITGIIDKLDKNRISRFSYKNKAFSDDIIDGVDVFNINADNNIPRTVQTHEKVLDTGLRAQGASITRDEFNHFIGRASYNVNKLVQKIFQFFNLNAAAWAHNAFEYDAAAKYAAGDICYYLETIDGVRVYTYYQRTSLSPATISNILPTVTTHWSPVQDKTASSALLPFKAPGYQHKYHIVDLTSNVASTMWYPVIVTMPELIVSANTSGRVQILIEAYCNGQITGIAGNCRAELAVLSKFTGIAESSTDLIINNSFTNADTGTDRGINNSVIGYSKLPKGRQAVIWLKGGGRYALWNSLGSLFTLVTNSYNNNLDPAIGPVAQRVFNITPGTIHAKIKTPEATASDEAPNLEQVSGSLPLPKPLTGGSQLNSIRPPGLYIAETAAIANTINNSPINNPGPFTLLVEGDKNGLSVTVQHFTRQNTGDKYTRVLKGAAVIVPWYLASSPEGLNVVQTQGLYAFKINAAGHLILHYQTGTDIPGFHINEEGHLIADIA